MKVFVSHHDDVTTIMARAESPGIVGDMVVDVAPGETRLGLTYEQWRALPEGGHEFEDVQPGRRPADPADETLPK